MPRKSGRELVEQDAVGIGWVVRDKTREAAYGVFDEEPYMRSLKGKQFGHWEPLSLGRWCRQPPFGLPELKPGQKIKIEVRRAQ